MPSGLSIKLRGQARVAHSVGGRHGEEAGHGEGPQEGGEWEGKGSGQGVGEGETGGGGWLGASMVGAGDTRGVNEGKGCQSLTHALLLNEGKEPHRSPLLSPPLHVTLAPKTHTQPHTHPHTHTCGPDACRAGDGTRPARAGRPHGRQQPPGAPRWTPLRCHEPWGWPVHTRRDAHIMREQPMLEVATWADWVRSPQQGAEAGGSVQRGVGAYRRPASSDLP